MEQEQGTVYGRGQGLQRGALRNLRGQRTAMGIGGPDRELRMEN